MNQLGIALIGCILICIFTNYLPVKKELKKKLAIFLSGTLLLIFHTFKDVNTLPDIGGYINFYRNIRFLNDNSNGLVIWGINRFEPGWALLNYFLASISKNEFILIFITSLIIVSGYIVFIYRYSKIFWLSFIILFAFGFGQSLYVLRQYCALSICLFSIPYIINRKLFKFLFISGVAFLFHYSALIFIIIYWLYSFNINKHFIIKFSILMVLGAIFSKLAINIILSEVQYYSDVLSSDGGTTITGFFINLAVISLCIFSLNISSLKNENKLFFTMLCVSTIISFWGIGLPGIVRLNLYYTVSYITLIPYVISKINVTIRFPISLLVATCFLSLFYIALQGNSLSRYSLNVF